MCNVYKCGLIVQCLFLALEKVTEVAFEDFCEPERGSFHSMATRTSLSLVVETARLGRNFSLMLGKLPGFC